LRTSSVATWFLAIAVIGALGGPDLDVQTATGLLAVAVLLVVMNWFFHKISWTGWISAHIRVRRRVATPGARRRALLGLAILCFTSAYREGCEVVLFLENVRRPRPALVPRRRTGLIDGVMEQPWRSRRGGRAVGCGRGCAASGAPRAPGRSAAKG
jgi:hypothetical protein